MTKASALESIRALATFKFPETDTFHVSCTMPDSISGSKSDVRTVEQNDRPALALPLAEKAASRDQCQVGLAV
eukprot:565395-Rhodomonas_salina.1